MDRQAFEDGLDRYGGDLGQWPADLRAQAERLLASSAEARAAKADTDAVEACLRAPALGDAIPTNMAAVAMRQRQVRPARPAVRRVAWGAATAATLLFGMVIGNVQYQGHDDAPDQVVARALDVPGSVDVD